MQTKIDLEIDYKKYELQDDDLQNWADIECTYKRSDYGGVTRSFISKFAFVNEAYARIMALYDRDGCNSYARVILYLMNDNLVFQPVFVAELDFSTVTYTNHVFNISAIDASTAAKIKANKSVKYELTLGEDVIKNGQQYEFDRLQMMETATYEITDGTSEEDGSLSGTYDPANNHRIYVGQVGKEVGIGNCLLLNEDQTYDDGFILSARKKCTVTLDYSVNVSIAKGCAELQLMKGNSTVCVLHNSVSANPPWERDRNWTSIEAVMNYINSISTIKSDWNTLEFDRQNKWVVVDGMVWVARHDSNGSPLWEETGKTELEYNSNIKEGSINITMQPDDRLWIKFCSDEARDFSINSSSFKFTWTTRGEPVLIDNVDPQDLLEAILAKMGVYHNCVIDRIDSRIKDVLILPAESIRDIPNAKIYASFDDFCKWMETVFGYTYIIDDDSMMITFKHRPLLFGYDRPPVIDIDNIRDPEYSIDKSVLYSNVKVGYNKKDYEGVNGRDEFNFNTTYTTDYRYEGKSLELISPFRADSYGIEFLVEKRGEDTTDNQSDKDVFFVTGIDDGEVYKPNRTPNIENSLTGTLINGEFSPIRCVWANAQYISIMLPRLDLTFASTEGNADIVINGTGISDDLPLEDCEMLTPGELKFTTNDLTEPVDLNSYIRVKTDDYIYGGYIREINIKYARPEAAEYKIMISSKTPCS